MTVSLMKKMQKKSFAAFMEAGIPLRQDELTQIEIADFGLENFEHEGACIATLIATDRYSIKALYLFPGQSLPEHWHPPIGADPGKQETIRVVYGQCIVVTDGTASLKQAQIPLGKQSAYSCRNERVCMPGDQLTLGPGQKHWFQGGALGTVVYSFSSTVRDLQDGFTDQAIVRKPIIEDD